ncbi:unnamed protein product, partial [Closterium sp. NIES-53]
AKGDCYRCVPPDPGIAAAALGASESGTLPGTAPAEALHTFTLDSGASRCFFRDSTTLTPLSARVSVRLADPSTGPVVARPSTVLPCPAVSSSSLSGLHLPSFSTNLVSTAAIQDAMVTTTTPGGQRGSICTCTRTGHHLATFTRRPGSSLYTLATEPPQVAASAQVSASGQVAPPCPCRLLSHQTLLWHHRLGHPSLPRLRGMHSRLLISGLPRSLPPLPPSPAPPCLPCVEGRQRATPHSSSFPPTTAPLQTLHMDVWGPARVSGQGRECYFLLVVDDYTWYTTVFPLRSKDQVIDVLIPWIRAVRLQLRERFRADLPVLRLHSDRGGEFSSDLLREFCRGEGILQSFTLPESPQKNGIAERRIGLVMEVTRTSMIHVAAPHFLWPFVAQYAAHQLNLWPHLLAGDLAHTALDGEGWRCVDVPGLGFLCICPRYVRGQALRPRQSLRLPWLCPSRTWLVVLPPYLTPCPPFSERHGVERGGAELEGAESGGTELQGAASSGGSASASLRLSPQQLREWLVRRARLWSGATGAGGAGFTAGAGVPGGTAATGPGGARIRGFGAGAGGAGFGGAGAGGAGAGGAGAFDPGGTSQPSFQSASPLPAPSPYTEQTGGLTERREPASRPASPVRIGRRVPRPRPPPVLGTHTMTLRPSSVPLRVPLPAPPESSLPEVFDPESDRARATSPTVSRLLATAVSDPSF